MKYYVEPTLIKMKAERPASRGAAPRLPSSQRDRLRSRQRLSVMELTSQLYSCLAYCPSGSCAQKHFLIGCIPCLKFLIF